MCYLIIKEIIKENLKMSRIFNSFEFVDGLRNSRQVSYRNNLFSKHSGIQWRCTRCSSMLSINEEERAVTKGPTEHKGHSDSSNVRLAVLRAIKKMKDEAYS